MVNTMIKTHYSAMEIASFGLKNAPHAHKNVQEKAKRENWVCRKRQGKGGGGEYKLAYHKQFKMRSTINKLKYC